MEQHAVRRYEWTSVTVAQTQETSSFPPAKWGCEPSHTCGNAILEWMRRLTPIMPTGYFDTRVEGWENLPPSPALLVGNHSAGSTTADVWTWGTAWYAHHGMNRIFHTLAHDMLFAIEPIARTLAKVGVLRAQPDIAERVLREHRRDLLVYPGGDRDAWRPSPDRYRVRFSGRKGYARLAIRTGATIVPLAHDGSHDSIRVLTDGVPVARALRFPELFRTQIFPLHLSLPFGVTFGPWPHVPLPSIMRYRVGRPVSTLGLDPDRPEDVAALDHQVRLALQEELNELQATRVVLREKVSHVKRLLLSRLQRRS